MRALPFALLLTAVPALLAAPPADTALTGTWRVAGLELAKGKSTLLGELKIDASGSYQWTENKLLAGLGPLQAHQPSGGARAGTGCWLFHRGKGDLYVYRDGDALEVYDAASNSLIGRGSKTGGKHR